MTDIDPIEAYVRRVQADTRRYVQDLLAENEKLRVTAATLQAEKAVIKDELASTKHELERHRTEEEKLERRLAEVAAENRRFSEEYVFVEQQNSNLANLYVASARLHSTLDRREILAVIIDIIEFLVGCEEIGVFEVEGEKLRLSASKGVDEARWATVGMGEGAIGRTALTGQPYTPLDSGTDPDGLTICTPLKVDGRVSGVIALFGLLPQKAGRLESIDFDLLNLLAAQAGTALATGALMEGTRLQRTTDGTV
jgi:nitrate/nitrite-specific signal transduction histidine kinase